MSASVTSLVKYIISLLICQRNAVYLWLTGALGIHGRTTQLVLVLRHTDLPQDVRWRPDTYALHRGISRVHCWAHVLTKYNFDLKLKLKN